MINIEVWKKKKKKKKIRRWDDDELNRSLIIKTVKKCWAIWLKKCKLKAQLTKQIYLLMFSQWWLKTKNTSQIAAKVSYVQRLHLLQRPFGSVSQVQFNFLMCDLQPIMLWTWRPVNSDGFQLAVSGFVGHCRRQMVLTPTSTWIRTI